MEVALIIPTKNEEKSLPPLLKSLKKQTFNKFDILIADANSKDKTISIAKKYNCTIVEGGLPAIGRDNGAKEAIKRGAKTLIFIDSDVVIPKKDFIKKVVNEFKKRNLDVACTEIEPIEVKNRKILNAETKLFYHVYNLILNSSSKGKSPFMQNFMVSKSKVHNKIGGFGNLDFGEDSAYSKKAVRMGYKFGVLKSPGKIALSIRRFEEKGFWKMVILYLYFNARIIFGHEFLIKEKSVYFN